MPCNSSRINIGSVALLKMAEIKRVKTTYSGALFKSLELIKISIGRLPLSVWM